jgi:hypothetical protein
VRKQEGRRTFFFGGELGRGEVVCNGARVELSPDVEDVIFGEACRGEAIKAAQGLDLCLLMQGGADATRSANVVRNGIDMGNGRRRTCA